MGQDVVKVAVVQLPPVLLDRDGTIKTVVDAVSEVASAGAGLVVFPETFVPGYPVWIWGLRPQGDYDTTSEIHAQLLANSVDLTRDDLRPVQEAAASHGVVVVCGVHEREGSFSRATIYNTLVTIGCDGTVLNRHRKLVPTNPERMIWGQGDASGLRVVDTPFGRLGGLICWENYMPLARYTLYAEGVQIYVASTWDEGEGWLATMRHIASEGRCWVIGSGCALNSDDIPPALPARNALFPDRDTWLNSGDSVILDPHGNVVAGPCTASTASCTPTSTRRCPLAPIGRWTSPDTMGAPTSSPSRWTAHHGHQLPSQRRSRTGVAHARRRGQPTLLGPAGCDSGPPRMRLLTTPPGTERRRGTRQRNAAR